MYFHFSSARTWKGLARCPVTMTEGRLGYIGKNLITTTRNLRKLIPKNLGWCTHLSIGGYANRDTFNGVKETRKERINNEWFHLSDIPEEANLINGNRNQNSSYLQAGWGEHRMERAQENFLGWQKCYTPSLVWWSHRVCISETHWPVHLNLCTSL